MELSQVLQALRNADAAGDVEGAKRLAQIAREMQARGAEGQAPDPNKSGFTAAASAGIERLKGEAALLGGKLGVMSEEEAQAYKEEKDRAAQARFTPTQEGWLDAPWLKLKETAGGSVPYMAAPLVVGAAATGLGAPGVAAALLGGAASAAQFTGSNLRAQMDTGKSLKETDAGAAALAAIPQAALDTLSFRMMPGIGKLFGAAGAQVTEEAAKKIAEQSLKKVAADYALSTGKTMGVEGLTEAAQQVFERLQAGLQINDPEARKDYLENFIGGAALAAVLGPLGRYQERGQIKRFGQEKEDERRREELLARGEKKEEAPPAPELDMATAFPRAQELQAQINALRAQKVAKPKDELEKARNAQIEKEVKALVAELTPLAQFVAKNRNAAPAPAASPATTADKGPGLFGEMPVPEQPEKNLLGGELQRAPIGETLTDEENAAAARSAGTRMREDGRPWTRDELETQWNTIEDSINTLRERARSETDVNTLRALSEQVRRLEEARKPLDAALASKNLPKMPLPPGVEKVGRSEAALQAKIKRLQKQADDAGENGDVAARLRALEKLQVLQQDNAQMGLFTPDAQATRDMQAGVIGQEVGAAREQREGERQAYERRQQEDAARAARLKQLLAQAEAATNAQEERRLRAEIAEIENLRRDTSRTEQLSLIDEDTTGPRVVSGAGVSNSRERLLYELQKARAARALAATRGDRDARERATRQAEIALDNLREFDTREQREQPENATGGELADILGGTRQPAMVDTRPDLIDARTRAFREYVSLLDRFNRGRGDLAGLKDAENTIIENLIKEAEQARGGPLPSGEKQFAQARARGLLNELKMRFGDTRSDIDIGTRENPERMDETLIPAYGSQAARGAQGISRFESQPAGFRTFGNRYAAADSILEGLDELSNRLSSTTGGARVERSMTPAEVSPERVGQMVQAAKGRLQGEDADLLDRIDANLPAIQKAGPRRSAAVAQWLYKRVNGLAATEDAQEVRATLAELEQGMRSETEQATQYAGQRLTAEQKKAVKGTELESREGVLGREATGETRRAVQGEMFPGTQDNVFDSFAEFDEALASPELAQIRKDLGLAGQTASAAAQQVSKVQAEIDRITREINAATALEADIKAQPQRTMEEAQALSTGVERDLLGLYREIDIVLAPFQNQYEKAVQAVLQAQARSLRLAEALQQNFDGMEEFQTASTAAQSDAMRAVEQAKRRLKATIDLMVRQRQETFDALAQLTTSTSLDAYKTFAQGRDFGEDLQRQAVAAHADLIRAQRGVQGLPPTADKMQAFLRQDFELRRELRSAQARIGGLTTARNRLNNMRQDAYRGVFTDEVRQEVFRRERDLAVAQQIVADARAGVDRTAQEVREMLTPVRGELEDQRRALQREVRTTEAEVQARRETPARGAAARERVDENERMAARDAGYREEQARLERAAGPQQTADGERVLDEAGGKAEGAASTLGARRVTFPDRAEKKFTSTKYLRLLNRSLDDSITAEERQQAKDDLAELVLRATKAEQAVAKRIDALVDARQKKVEQIAEHKKEYPNRVKEREKMQRSLRMLENKLQTARGTEITDIPTRAEQRRAKADLDRETRGMPAASADEVSAEIASTQKTRRVTSPVMEDVRTKRKFESTKETKERKPVGKAKQFRPREELAYRREQLDTINARLENEASGPAGARLLDAKKRLQERIQQLEAKLGKSATAAEVDVGDALYQRGQQADGEALSDTAVQALEADNIAAALNNVVQTSKTPINQAVARRLRSLLGNTRVILDPNLTDKDGKRILGAASGDGMTIWLNPNGGLNEETLLHEAVHAATERVLRTPDSQLTPEQVAAKRELQALFARVKADPSFTSVDAKASLSEFVAEAMTNPVLQEQLARKPWKLQNAWEGFKRVLLKLLGVATPPGDMLTASLAAVDTIMQAPRPGEVEGGAGTSAFKRWFGNSKVVDADGKPLVVYHGTTADFSAFSKKGVRPNFTSPQKHLGFFFTDDPGYADRYTQRWGEFKDGANTMPVYLSLQNPKVEPITKIGDIEDRMKQGEAKAYREALASQGYDGIIFEGETPTGFVREFVAFRPEQIKSAIGNNGQFDPANPDIRYQQRRESIIASPRTAGDAIKSNAGLAFRTQAIDRLAPAEKVASYLKDPADGMQAMYYLRTYGQRMSLVSQAVSNGAPQLVEKQRSDGKKEWLIESQKGANLKDVTDELKSAGIKDSQKLERLFTLDLVGRRAANVGWDKLDFENPDAVKAEVTQAREEIKALGARDAFDRAAKLYNMFNKDMLKFMVQTGAISKESYDALSKNGDYVPFYRQRGGNAELVIGKETPVRIGNLKDSPHLRELIGGSDKILPFSASAVQNVSLLTDLAVRNVGTRNLAFEMASMGLGKIGKGDAKGTNVFTFKDDGVDKYMILDEEAMDTIGVPADLMVKGLAGIPTMLPAAMRLLALPSQLLRKSITLSPVYAVRQLFRDSTAAAIASGANITPVFSALKQLGRKSATQSALERRGITGGQVFTGTGEDISKILRDIGAGKNPMRLLAWLEARSMEADASTRRAQYESYRKQGLSEMEATMMSLESMNFTRQGLSPSIHMVGQLVPFMNAQIQGLDVLYRAAFGKMPMNERLGIQRKMMVRGALLASLTLAYAYAMQDDPAYKNATPEERAMNWFVRIPGLDEPVRIPIPFEIGYIFKAMPEAVLNLALGSQDAKATGQAVNRILINTLPGGSNMLSVPVNGMQIPVPIPMPAAIKPLIEMGTGVSLFTRRPIVSGAQADALPEYQYNERTSEIAKDLGQFFGMSPAIIENTIRGYMSGTGLALMQAASMAYGDTGGPERAARRMSELPLIGALFQPNDGLALVNNVYDRLKEIDQVKTTFDNLVKTGERAEAERFLQEHLNTLTLADTAGNAKQMLNRLVQMERAVKASDLSGAEKAEQLKELRRVKIELAGSMREVLGTR